jgi:hypothetical protein
MSVIQQHSTAPVVFELREEEVGRHIPLESRKAGQMLQWPTVTNLTDNLAFTTDGQPVSFKIQEDCQIIQLPKITDPRGSLSFIEGERHIPFKIQSAYWAYDVSNTAGQGNYACRGQQEFIIAIAGSIEIVVDNGYQKTRYCLNRPDVGLYVPNWLWRQIENFSSDAVVLTLASRPVGTEDRHLDGFRELEVLQ